jgi:YVTN family beta-propeller protein
MTTVPFIRLATAAAILLMTAGCEAVTSPASSSPLESIVASEGAPAPGRVVIANRGSANLSVINSGNGTVIDVPMPDAGEPMYVVSVAAQNRVFVGDRANARVVAFDARTMEVDGFAPTGPGVFHMWADPQGKQLWVVDNVGNTLTVIDPKRLTVLATVPVTGGTPHDVVVGPKGEYAYASVFVAAGADQVVQYRTDTFAETGRVEVGEDPHLSVDKQAGLLFVPAQGANTVFTLALGSLALVDATPIPAAHGAGMTSNGRVFYTTNIAGGGTDAVFALDAATRSIIGAADTSFPVPHNLAVSPSGRQLFVTHSGATSDKVSICSMTATNPVPSCDETVTVGLNPFGLAFVR